MPKCILVEQCRGQSESGIVLQKIEITSPPNKTNYLAGDTFNTAGMVVTASYGIGQNATIATAEVTGYQVSPQTLTDGISYVTIIYTEMGQTC